MKRFSSDIKNIADLSAHHLLLKNEIKSGEIRIRKSIEDAGLAIVAKITESVSKNTLERNLEYLSDSAGKLLSKLSVLLVKKIVSRKVEFLNAYY